MLKSLAQALRKSDDDTLNHQAYEYRCSLRFLRFLQEEWWWSREQGQGRGLSCQFGGWPGTKWEQSSQLLPQGGQLTGTAPWFKETQTCPLTLKYFWRTGLETTPLQCLVPQVTKSNRKGSNAQEGNETLLYEHYFLQPRYPSSKPISFLFSIVSHVPSLHGEINNFNIVSQVSPRGSLSEYTITMCKSED